jgi:hypothetical protein
MADIFVVEKGADLEIYRNEDGFNLSVEDPDYGDSESGWWGCTLRIQLTDAEMRGLVEWATKHLATKASA